MTEIMAHLPAVQVVLPLLGAFVAALFRREPITYAIALLVSFAMPVVAGLLLWQVLTTGTISYALGGWAPPLGIEYRVDSLNAFVLLVISAVSAAAIPYARRSIRFEVDAERRPWFYSVYLLCLAGLLGVTITGDAFNAFVFLEISSLSTYVLIAVGIQRRGLLAAFQYLIMGTVGATFYVIGVGILYLLTGTLNMADMAERLAAVPPTQMRALVTGFAFIVVGISLKLALFPLHFWLPNAYAFAPSFVAVFLSATATKAALYLLVRYYFSIFGVAVDLGTLPVAEVFLVLSLAGIFVASIIAVFESNLKRMFAFSSVAQIGYMTLGVAIGNTAGVTGTLVHLINHAAMKAALFMALGAAFFRAGAVTLSDFQGLGRRMPLSMAALSVAGLALVGVPGTSGFISKWYLAIGAMDREWWPVAYLVLAGSLITLLYVARVLEVIWLRAPSGAAAAAADPPPSMLFPLLGMAAVTVYLGLDTRLSAGIASVAADMLIGALR